MKTGVELIVSERQEQIEKHGFDSDHDSRDFNSSGEMITAAGYILDIAQGNVPGSLTVTAQYPRNWHPKFKSKFAQKTRIEKLTVAGALIAAEIDRLHGLSNHHET